MFNVITGAADAIGDAVRQTVAGLPGGSASFRVQPDQVYELANRFEAIADKIQGAVSIEANRLWVEAPGADQPSESATDRLIETGFGEAGLVTRLDEYARQLRAAARSLRATGQQYGLTDHTEGERLSAGLS